MTDNKFETVKTEYPFEPPHRHFSRQVLQEYHQDLLNDKQKDQVAAALKSCQSCKGRYDVLLDEAGDKE